ncbi:hypothetical protein ACFY0F_21505 [Streptomyces sp. NPDC001544]|uniref:hypothetical protein n=1 Tax=Streptomyces sp. NPDC001544 TaxID=3364584 RepID=UPI0036BDAC3D
MLAVRLTRLARPAVQLRRLLVAAAAAGTGFLLLCTLGYALGHPDAAPTSLLLRLGWCALPLAATVQLAVAVARADPGTRPRTGLSALGLGPARLMAVSALTTALSCTLGSTTALVLFLHLRGDLPGTPFDGATAFLAADRPLPVPAALTLLALIPVTASAVVALVLRPRDARVRVSSPAAAADAAVAAATAVAAGSRAARGDGGTPARAKPGVGEGGRSGPLSVPGRAPGAPAIADGAQQSPDEVTDPETPAPGAYRTDAPGSHPPPREAPGGLPWGIAVLAAGLAVESYAAPSTAALPEGPAAVLAGWILTALGLRLAAPGLTHLCGRLLQAVRPGALRLLAGRGLMAESPRIGRPLGVVCAVVSGVYAMTARYDRDLASFGPLTRLGTLLVAGCTMATLLMAAVEARESRADTTAALLRLGARATVLRAAAALRAGALLALFGPLTLVVAGLAALPLAR